MRAIHATTEQPTIALPDGSYHWIDAAGTFWGTWYVGTNWCGERFCCRALPDGLPR